MSRPAYLLSYLSLVITITSACHKDSPLLEASMLPTTVSRRQCARPQVIEEEQSSTLNY